MILIPIALLSVSVLGFAWLSGRWWSGLVRAGYVQISPDEYHRATYLHPSRLIPLTRRVLREVLPYLFRHAENGELERTRRLMLVSLGVAVLCLVLEIVVAVA